jgi:hypothetical protein
VTTVAERAAAVAAADGSCPRCGTRRAPDQRYCLECGLALPEVTGRIPALRRRFITRFGRYPGDWVWASLVTLVIAVAGAAAAIVVSDRRAEHASAYVASSPGITLAEPATAAATTAPVRTNSDTSTLPKAPEPGTKGATRGRFPWPVGENGWTIVLVSYPKTTGHDAAFSTATRAAKAGLEPVGVLDSDKFASLQPGYFVVFTGVFNSKTTADSSVATARQAGFAGAYSRAIAR